MTEFKGPIATKGAGSEADWGIVLANENTTRNDNPSVIF